jgi:ubiquinol-cytochrome c reductase cytochrome c subunit
VFLLGLRVFVVAFATVVATAGLKARTTSVVVQAFRPADDAVERGKHMFMKIGCYQCHGREAQGASTGPRLGPNPLPLPAFARAIRTPRNDMPPYSMRILSDGELADLYAFVAARPRPHELPK